jgi:hypothetical protein
VPAARPIWSRCIVSGPAHANRSATFESGFATSPTSSSETVSGGSPTSFTPSSGVASIRYRMAPSPSGPEITWAAWRCRSRRRKGPRSAERYPREEVALR